MEQDYCSGESVTYKESELNKDQISEGFNKLLESKAEEMQRNPKTTDAQLAESNPGPTSIEVSYRAKEDFASYQRRFGENKHQQQQIFLRIWDFNGNSNFPALQFMFLEPEVPTVIVMDITKSLHKPLFHDSQAFLRTEHSVTPAEYLIYNLEIIHFKAMERNIQPAISLVLTHIDEVLEQHRESHIKSYINNIQELLDGKPYAVYVSEKNIHITENKVDSTKIKDQIFGLILNPTAWGNEIPARWSQLEADILDKFPSQSVKCIQTYICTEMANVYGTHEDEVESFLEFHHSIGDWIYCSDAGTVVTDPQWFFNILQSLFKNSKIQNKAGLVSEKDLHILWKGEDVPVLVNLMSSLQLMVPLQSQNEKTFLIPSLLPMSTELDGMGSSVDKMNKVYTSLHTVADTRHLCLDTYHKLMCRLGNETNWKIQACKLSYLNAYFAITESTMVALTLIESQIKLTAWSEKGVEYKNLQTNLQYIREIIAGLLHKSGIPENDFFQILCPHSKVGDECLVKINVSKNPEDQEIILVPEETKCPVHNEDLSPKDFKQFRLEKQEPKVKLGWLLKTSQKSAKVEGKQT